MDFSILPEWLTAIGTVSAVIVALFQKPVRDKINRPKIEISCDNSSQCKVELKSDADDADSSMQLSIRVKLENKGNYIATHSALYVDSYLTKRNSDESYVKKDITPRQIRDYRKSKPSQIVPHLQYYFEVATIKKYESMTTQDENGKSKQFYKLYLLGENDSIELGKGSFIIPLKFYCSRIDVKIAYLKVLWDSDDYVLDSRYFSMEMLDENDYRKLKIAK